MAGSGTPTESRFASDIEPSARAPFAPREFPTSASAHPLESAPEFSLPRERRLDLERDDARFRIGEMLAALSTGSSTGISCGARSTPGRGEEKCVSLDARFSVLGIWRRRELSGRVDVGPPAVESRRDTIARRLVRRLEW